MLDVSAVTMVFFECSSTCTRFDGHLELMDESLEELLEELTSRKKALTSTTRSSTAPRRKAKMWIQNDSNEISNQVGNKKGKSNRQLRILLKLLNTIFGFGMFVATGTKTIFSSRSPHYFSFKMHRNEEERPKAVLPVLQPQAARRDTFETPQNLGTFLQILFNLFRFVVTLLPNSWKGFDGSNLYFFGWKDVTVGMLARWNVEAKKAFWRISYGRPDKLAW